MDSRPVARCVAAELSGFLVQVCGATADRTLLARDEESRVALRPGSEAKRGESKGLMNDGREARESDDGLSEAEARDARK